MAFTEPSLLPEWVSDTPPNGPVDSISGQAAIAEPSAAKKGTGFTYQEKPPRQDHNWLFNLIWLWVQWFKQQTDGLWTNQSALITNSGQTPDIESEQIVTALDRTYLPRYFLEGFNYTSGSHYLTIYKGACVGTNGLMINGKNDTSWASALQKDVMIAWVRGVGGGSSASILPLVHQQWYYVWAIRLADSTQVDFCFTDSPNPASAVVDVSVTSVRRIGTFKWYDTTSKVWEMEKLGKYFAFNTNVSHVNVSPNSSAGWAQVQCALPNVTNLKANLVLQGTYAGPAGTRIYQEVQNGNLTGLSAIRRISEMQVGDQDSRGEFLAVPLISSSLAYINFRSRTPAGAAATDPNALNIFTVGFFDPLDNSIDSLF